MDPHCRLPAPECLWQQDQGGACALAFTAPDESRLRLLVHAPHSEKHSRRGASSSLRVPGPLSCALSFLLWLWANPPHSTLLPFVTGKHKVMSNILLCPEAAYITDSGLHRRCWLHLEAECFTVQFPTCSKPTKPQRGRMPCQMSHR